MYLHLFFPCVQQTRLQGSIMYLHLCTSLVYNRPVFKDLLCIFISILPLCTTDPSSRIYYVSSSVLPLCTTDPSSRIYYVSSSLFFPCVQQIRLQGSIMYLHLCSSLVYNRSVFKDLLCIFISVLPLCTTDPSSRIYYVSSSLFFPCVQQTRLRGSIMYLHLCSSLVYNRPVFKDLLCIFISVPPLCTTDPFIIILVPYCD